MDTKDVTRRILAQRAARYGDLGPDFGQAGTARFRLETDRLRLGYARAALGRSPELVARVIEFAQQRRRPVQWMVVPQRAGETELVAALEQAGFSKTEDLLLMACGEPISVPSSPGITISTLLNAEQMLAYEYANRLCFYDDTHPLAVAVKQRATDRWREQLGGWFRYYAAFVGDRLVAGCYASLFEDIPTIMGVLTLPEIRRQGVASQLLSTVASDLLGVERSACCLFVERRNPAQYLYRKLGFVHLVDMLTFNLETTSVSGTTAKVEG